jgi:undecaprenyl-diphosphatase
MAFFRLLASISLPKAVTFPLILLVRSGDGWIWALIASALWFLLPFPEVERVVLHCVLAIGISLVLYFPIKFIGRRPRPYDNGLDIKPQVPPLDKYSFPSGHTMNNLAVALTLASHFPSLSLPAIGIPILLGTLRVLFGVHYLSDIIGGGVLGAFAFTLAKAFFPLSGP